MNIHKGKNQSSNKRKENTFMPLDDLDDAETDHGIYSLAVTANVDGSVYLSIWGKQPGGTGDRGHRVSTTLSGADWRSLVLSLDRVQKVREELADVLESISGPHKELLGLSGKHFQDLAIDRVIDREIAEKIKESNEQS